MTVTAQDDQIVFGIFPGMTPKVLMMNLETFVALRSIGIAIRPFKNSFAKAPVGSEIETHGPVFWSN